MIFLQLLCAHVVADFYLQSYKMCVCKLQLLTGKGWICQIGHAFVHGLLAYIFVSDWTHWLLPLLVFVSHLIIDVLKDICLSKIQYKPNDVRSNWECVLFVIDQALHILVLCMLLKYVNIAENTAIYNILRDAVGIAREFVIVLISLFSLFVISAKFVILFFFDLPASAFHDLPQLFHLGFHIRGLCDFRYHGNMPESFGTQKFQMVFFDTAHD